MISCVNAQGLVETEQPKGKQHEEDSSLSNSLFFSFEPYSIIQNDREEAFRLRRIRSPENKINYNSLR